MTHRLVARVETDRSWAERGAITMLGDTLRRRLGVTLGPEGQAKVEEIAERLYAEAAKKIGAVNVRAT